MEKTLNMAIIFVLFFVSILNAQPYRERILTPEDFGNIDRLEQPQQKSLQKLEQPRQYEPKYQKSRQSFTPNFGMNNWGGDPFKSFSSGRPWGRMDEKPMGFGNQDTYEKAVKKERYPIIVIVTTEENGDLTVTSIVVKNPLRSKSLEAIIRSAK
jgi:hypothetical protein